MARSKRAEEFTKLAGETQAKADALPEGDAVRAWLEGQAEHWRRRAAEAQRKADHRAYLRAHPEVQRERQLAAAELEALKREARARRSKGGSR